MEKVDLLGVRADGSSEVIGQVPMPPKMKMRDIVRDMFGEPSGDPDACDDASMCMYALECFHEWLLEQGWMPPKVAVTPKQK